MAAAFRRLPRRSNDLPRYLCRIGIVCYLLWTFSIPTVIGIPIFAILLGGVFLALAVPGAIVYSLRAARDERG